MAHVFSIKLSELGPQMIMSAEYHLARKEGRDAYIIVKGKLVLDYNAYQNVMYFTPAEAAEYQALLDQRIELGEKMRKLRGG